MSKPCALTPLPNIMRLGGWRDIESVNRYMGLIQDDRLAASVEAAWSTA
jgi:predicted phosphoadenosine phosphosulfate sulfurtransferase